MSDNNEKSPSDKKYNDIKEALVKLANSASVVQGMIPLSFTSSVAFDIETAPAQADLDDSSLLDAQSARVAAIGYFVPATGRYFISYDKDEAAMLRQFWNAYQTISNAGSKMIGFNIFGFDLPFIIRRSWGHGVSMPRNVMTSSGRYWSDTFIDLMQSWKCGSYKDYISLDKLAKFLGCGGKNGSGELFYKLWSTDRAAAIDYLVNDVKITHACAQKMGMANVA
jgi:DNA polymerase elongation subunit (family B)